MEIQPKDSDLVKAQAEAFLETQRGVPKKMAFTDMPNLLEKKDDDLRGEELYSKYVKFLRDRKLSKPAISDRLQAFEFYKPFSAIIDNIKKELLQQPDPADHEGVVGNRGILAVKFQKDHKMYVARLNKVTRYRDNRYASSQIEEYYHKMKIGQSIPHFEQVVAYSAENGVVISELAKGKSIDEIGVSIYEQITNEQIEEILESLVLAAHNGVVIDEHPNNIFYDPTVGFTIIDFKRKEDVMPSERPVELQIAKFLFQLLSLDISSTSLVDKETPQYILEDEQLCLNFCKRMVEVVLHLDTTHGINSDLQRQILSILNSKMQHIEENILDIERNIEKI